MPHSNLRILMLALIVSYACYLRAEHNQFSRHLSNAFEEIHQQALYNVGERKLFNGAVQGMVDVLRVAGDEHSAYWGSPEIVTHFNERMEQRFGGIGVLISLRLDPPGMLVSGQPEPGTPAAKSDLRIGDEIIEVNGKSVRDALKNPVNGFAKATSWIKGPIGEKVQLTVLRRGSDTPIKLEVARAEIELPSVLGYKKDKNAKWIFKLEENPKIAHVRVTSFGEHTAEELFTTVSQLQNEGVETIILDLRGNPGGFLHIAVAMCDMFLPAGKLIVSTKDRYQNLLEEHISTSDCPFPDMRLAILIDVNSASASEIVAACLQDHGRAILLGERSFGKGTVQYTRPIGPPISVHGARIPPMLKLTSASYWRPSGKQIHHIHEGERDPHDPEDWGVQPDKGMEIILTDEEYAAYLENRARRDTFNPEGVELPKNGKTSDGPFVDKVLELAIEKMGGS